METTQPRNFSWFVDGKLAGLAYPRDTDIPFLADAGIKTLINITETGTPDYFAVAEAHGIGAHTIPTQAFCPPSNEHIQQFLKIVGEAPGVSQNAREGMLFKIGRRTLCYFL